MRQFYSQFVRSDDLCFDIGANIGTRVETFLNLGARVVAVEPQADCFERLSRRYQENERVQLVHAGLDKSDGARTIYICESDTLSSMSLDWIARVKANGRYAALRWAKEEVVRVLTLDDLIDRYGMPAFCKIDVEGFELQVMQGLSRMIPCLSFEFSLEMLGETKEVIRYLARIGDYRFNYFVGEPHQLALLDWIDADSMVSRLTEMKNEGDILAKC